MSAVNHNNSNFHPVTSQKSSQVICSAFYWCPAQEFRRKAAEIFRSQYTTRFQRSVPSYRLLWDREIHQTFLYMRGCPLVSTVPQQKQTALAYRGQTAGQLGQIKPRMTTESHLWLSSITFQLFHFFKQVGAGINCVWLHTNEHFFQRSNLSNFSPTYTKPSCLSPSWWSSWFFVFDTFSCALSDPWLFRAQHTPSCIFFSNFYFIVHSRCHCSKVRIHEDTKPDSQKMCTCKCSETAQNTTRCSLRNVAFPTPLSVHLKHPL